MTELAFYRKYTETVLRRYAELCDGAGRAPSLLGREIFRGDGLKIQAHGGSIDLRLDLERLISRLNADERRVIQRVACEGYGLSEAAALLGVTVTTCMRRYRKALDRMTWLLLESRLLEPLPWELRERSGGEEE